MFGKLRKDASESVCGSFLNLGLAITAPFKSLFNSWFYEFIVYQLKRNHSCIHGLAVHILN